MNLLFQLFKRVAIYRLQRTRNLRDIQRWMFRRHAQKMALHLPGQSLHFAELEQRSQQWASLMLSAGLQPGDAVLVAVGDLLHTLLLRFACVEAGLVQVAFLPSHGADFVCDCARQAAPKLAIIDASRMVELSTALHRQQPTLPVWEFAADGDLPRRAAACAALPVAKSVDIEIPLSLGFTSGTTGRPKMMALRQQQLLASMRLLLLNLADTQAREASMLIAVPLNGAGGGVLLPVLLAGGAVVIPEQTDAPHLLALIRTHRPARVFVTPSQLIDLLDCADASRDDFGSVEQLIYGSAPLAVARIREAIARFGPILQQGYGMAEALPPVAMLAPSEHVDDDPDLHESALSSVGRIARGVRVEVRGASGLALAQGEIGKIWIRTPTVFSGYIGQPELTAQVFDAQGFYFSGDHGYFDRRGRLHVLDREQDIIAHPQGTIYPRRVEERVHQCAGVKEAALVQVDGELHLCISVRSHPQPPPANALLQQLRAHLGQHLPTREQPQHIHVLAALPRSTLCKVLRRDVRAWVQLAAEAS